MAALLEHAVEVALNLILNFAGQPQDKPAIRRFFGGITKVNGFVHVDHPAHRQREKHERKGQPRKAGRDRKKWHAQDLRYAFHINKCGENLVTADSGYRDQRRLSGQRQLNKTRVKIQHPVSLSKWFTDAPYALRIDSYQFLPV